MAAGDVVGHVSATSAAVSTFFAQTPGNIGLIASWHRSGPPGTDRPAVTSGTGWTQLLHVQDEIDNTNARRGFVLWAKVLTDENPDPNIWSHDWGDSRTQLLMCREIEGPFDLDAFVAALTSVGSSGVGQASNLDTGATPGSAPAGSLVFGSAVVRHGAAGTIAWTEGLVDEYQQSNGTANANGLTVGLAQKVAGAAGPVSTSASWTTAEESTVGIVAIPPPGGGGGEPNIGQRSVTVSATTAATDAARVGAPGLRAVATAVGSAAAVASRVALGGARTATVLTGSARATASRVGAAAVRAASVQVGTAVTSARAVAAGAVRRVTVTAGRAATEAYRTVAVAVRSTSVDVASGATAAERFGAGNRTAAVDVGTASTSASRGVASASRSVTAWVGRAVVARVTIGGRPHTTAPPVRTFAVDVPDDTWTVAADGPYAVDPERRVYGVSP